MNNLLICLQDRSGNVRNEAEEIIKFSLNYVSIDDYFRKSEDFKPAINKDLKQILNKIKTENLKTSNNQETNNDSDTNNSNNNLHKENSTNILETDSKILNKNNSSTKKLPPKKNENSIKTESNDTEDNNDLSNYNSNTNNNTNNKPKKIEKKPKVSNSSSTNVKKVKLKRKLSEDDLQNPLGKSIDKQIGASSVNRLASNSTILKKNDKKAFSKTIQPTKTSAVFLMNVKVIPNKTKRLEKDRRVKFSLELISKEIGRASCRERV